ncbi:hypothetical protein ANN_17977 [Periplaneta americana]|uniref:Uncharacterized protein n=1 Tax=Periplaneta americana TaxID=6978 RepID=A0ABQ8SN11_PERAM|nr:hypothetical protein ANN_17977 [Periplaneta americana]
MQDEEDGDDDDEDKEDGNGKDEEDGDEKYDGDHNDEEEIRDEKEDRNEDEDNGDDNEEDEEKDSDDNEREEDGDDNDEYYGDEDVEDENNGVIIKMKRMGMKKMKKIGIVMKMRMGMKKMTMEMIMVSFLDEWKRHFRMRSVTQLRIRPYRTHLQLHSSERFTQNALRSSNILRSLYFEIRDIAYIYAKNSRISTLTSIKLIDRHRAVIEARISSNEHKNVPRGGYFLYYKHTAVFLRVSKVFNVVQNLWICEVLQTYNSSGSELRTGPIMKEGKEREPICWIRCQIAEGGEVLRIKRHNTIRSMIADALRTKNLDVHEEVHCIADGGSNRSIDIIAINRNKQTAEIIDPTIRFEISATQPTEVNEEKKKIYESTIQYLSAKYNIEKITVIGLFFGARGTIPKAFVKWREKYKLTRDLQDAIVTTIIKFSVAIFRQHLYGVHSI